jgi:hypothetical protein
MHIEKAHNAFKSWEYCGKEETRVEGPIEYGIPPAQRNKAGNCKERNAMLLAKGVVAAVEDGDIPLINLPKLKLAMDLYQSLKSNPPDMESLDNYWFHGPPGTGKSRGARARWENIYNKPLNKWWCQYQG